MIRVAALATAFGVLAASSLSAACATDYVHDSAAFFPGDFEAAWTKVADCAQSVPHSGKYVVVYANDIAHAAFEDATVAEYPQDSVFVKAQYDGSDCGGGYAGITAMRKDAPGSGTESDWKWQNVSGSGSIDMETYEAHTCINCHQSPASGKDLVQTSP